MHGETNPFRASFWYLATRATQEPWMVSFSGMAKVFGNLSAHKRRWIYCILLWNPSETRWMLSSMKKSATKKHYLALAAQYWYCSCS